MVDYMKKCSVCGENMQVLDRVESYYDDYSPYLSHELTDLNDGDSPGICSHMSVCPNCGNKEIIEVNNMYE